MFRLGPCPSCVVTDCIFVTLTNTSSLPLDHGHNHNVFVGSVVVMVEWSVMDAMVVRKRYVCV